MKKFYWESAEDFWYSYFNVFNMNAQSTLLAYSMISKKDSASTIASKMRQLKVTYSDEYEKLKHEYLESVGVSEVSVLTKISDIADYTYKDETKLKALELLMKYINTTADGSALNAMNTLQVSFTSPASAAIDEEVENPSSYTIYEED